MSAKTTTKDLSVKPHIVIIDDEEICLLGMEMLLFGTNSSLTCLLGGQEGLEYLLKYPKVDLIFLDLMMPYLSGLDLLKIIKNDSNLKNIPVIIQTGLRTELELEKALNLGAVSILKKPYTKEMVLDKINTILVTVSK